MKAFCTLSFEYVATSQVMIGQGDTSTAVHCDIPFGVEKVGLFIFPLARLLQKIPCNPSTNYSAFHQPPAALTAQIESGHIEFPVIETPPLK